MARPGFGYVAAMPFILSGFETQKAYEERELSWDGDREFPDERTAQEAAAAWLVSQGPEAQVEVISLAGNEGDVVAVITQRGVERIE